MESYDILFSVFTRLPLKSLLRFQSVSKSWNTIISDQPKVSNPKKLLLVQIDDSMFEFRDLESPQIVRGKQQFPLKIFRNPTALCSYNSLVLMKTHIDYKEYALWNPYTNECQTIACPYLNGMTPHGCGLCYDPSDDDYKVILIFKSFYAVYYVKRNYWRKKTISFSEEVRDLDAKSCECCSGISVDGYVFWGFNVNKISQLVYSYYYRIIYVDLKSDELKVLPQPNFTRDRYRQELFRLTSLEGRVGLYGGNNRSKELDVWIMEQDEWKLLIKINCNNFSGYYIENIVLLGYTRNGDILFHARWEVERIFIYDPKRRRFVKSIQISNDSKRYIIPICLESSYFPKSNAMHAQEKEGNFIKLE
ncbi:F-box/kelch-repeat protein At3g23880-like [Nicotiana tabacum]|uniref:F-box/kelch-repeat protein At3g23880-like n=1 Tax=Nicotiana tabacum TaxID=4097 RepID=A0AC58SM56_TOBAC